MLCRRFLCRRTCGLLLLTAFLCGCRAHPASLAITVIGDAVDDHDVQERKAALLGQSVAKADAMFGKRHDTLVDLDTGGKWVIYPEPGERMAESFYVVEATKENKITGLFKCKRNIDGLEDVYRTRELEDEILGLTPPECEATAGFGPPVLVLRSEVNGVIARFYDVHNWTHTRGARYCLLVFGHNNLCGEITFLGVTARVGEGLTPKETIHG